jgi:hypothetical protein
MPVLVDHGAIPRASINRKSRAALPDRPSREINPIKNI